MSIRQALDPPGRATRRHALSRAAALAGIRLLAAAGCERGGGPGDVTIATQPATVKVLSFNNPLFQQPKDSLLAALAKADPTLKPDVIVFPGTNAQFRTAVLTLYAGGDIPDAQWMHPSATSLYGSKKLLRPIDDLAKRDRSTPLGEFYPGVVGYLRWRESTYGLPWQNPGWVLGYNRALFKRLGVPLPDTLEKAGKWNWDAFQSTLRSLTRGGADDPNRTIGFQGQGFPLDQICSWIWRNGGEVFSKDARKFLMNEPPAVEVLQDMADLHLRHQVVNFGTHERDFPDGFFSGRVGMRQVIKQAVSPDQNDLVKATFSLGMVPVYKGKKGRVNRSAPLGFGVARGGPNGDAGWRWVRFMAGPEAAAIFVRGKASLPVRSKYAQLPEYAQSMFPWEVKEYWLDSVDTARALDQPAAYQEIEDLWAATWRDIQAQKAPIKSLMDDLARQANALLANEPA